MEKRKITVSIADHSGYCFGVKRAMDIVERAAEDDGSKVFTLGELIHNPRALAGLEKKGVMAAHKGGAGIAAGSTLILPTHGTPANVRTSLDGRGLKLVDAVCPRVLAVRKRIERAIVRGCRVVVAGEAGHAEVIFYKSLSPKSITIVGSPDAALRLRPGGKCLFLAAQTTFSPAGFDEIVEILRPRCSSLDVFHSICGHTLDAQAAAAVLAKRCQVMIVVGGRTSSNTRRLREACEAAGARAIQIESATELRLRDFAKAASVGVTAGASTPPVQIAEVMEWLEKHFDTGTHPATVRKITEGITGHDRRRSSRAAGGRCSGKAQKQ